MVSQLYDIFKMHTPEKPPTSSEDTFQANLVKVMADLYESEAAGCGVREGGVVMYCGGCDGCEDTAYHTTGWFNS